MKKLWPVLLVLLAGCPDGVNREPKPDPPPTIEVRMGESADAVVLHVNFLDHLERRYNGSTTCYSAEIELRNMEQAEAYEKQVQFLADKLKEFKTKLSQLKQAQPEKPEKDEK